MTDLQARCKGAAEICGRNETREFAVFFRHVFMIHRSVNAFNLRRSRDFQGTLGNRLRIHSFNLLFLR